MTISATEPTDTITFTDNVTSRIKQLIANEGNDALMFRISVQGGGCSGFQYQFSFDDEIGDGDLVIEKDGATLLVDPLSRHYLIGATLDYTENLQGSQFVISNPNAVSSCGCGSSFSA